MAAAFATAVLLSNKHANIPLIKPNDACVVSNDDSLADSYKLDEPDPKYLHQSKHNKGVDWTQAR